MYKLIRKWYTFKLVYTDVSGFYECLKSVILFILRIRKYGFFDLLFGGGEAIQSMFQLGFIPKEEDFREFSSVEYQQYNEKECDICGKMYTFNSDLPVSGNDIYAFSEKEKEFMLKGAEIIDNLCEKKTFISDDVKLRYVATLLPGVFSEGTKYACNEE